MGWLRAIPDRQGVSALAANKLIAMKSNGDDEKSQCARYPRSRPIVRRGPPQQWGRGSGKYARIRRSVRHCSPALTSGDIRALREREQVSQPS